MKKWIKTDHPWKGFDNLPDYQWKREENESIIYPIYGMYECYDFISQIERFETLEQAKQYFDK